MSVFCFIFNLIFFLSQALCVALTGLKLRDTPARTSRVLRLKARIPGRAILGLGGDVKYQG